MTEDNANTRSAAMTRAKSNLTIDLKDRKERVYSIVGWGQSHGEIIDNNDIVTTGNFNDGTLKQLQHTLWKGYDSKPSNLESFGERYKACEHHHCPSIYQQPGTTRNDYRCRTVSDLPDRTCRLPDFHRLLLLQDQWNSQQPWQGRQIHYHSQCIHCRRRPVYRMVWKW